MIDAFFDKKYDAETYNCAHFFAEIYQAETGRDITKKLQGFLLPPSDRFVEPSTKSNFHRLDKPLENCLILMRRPRVAPHVGLFLRGKVVHLTEHAGVQYMPLDIATLGFTKVRFYSC